MFPAALGIDYQAASVTESRTPIVRNLTGPTSAPAFGEVDTEGSITPTPSNPFDPAAIAVVGYFVDPTGRLYRRSGFFFQNYVRHLKNGHEELAPQGLPNWHVRFAPPTPGTWSWWWRVTVPTGEISTPKHALSILPSRNHGFLNISTRDSRYLSFQDGSPYFAVGENVAWYDAGGTYDYDKWFYRLSSAGATYARVTLSPWSLALETRSTGLGNYRRRLARAWQLDYVLNAATHYGIYLVISLLNSDVYRSHNGSGWRENPYNARNGGPLKSPSEVFTDGRARVLFERLAAYVIARWGWSPNVLAWELWNEADLVDGYPAKAANAWQEHMYAFINSLDGPRHLITSSYARTANTLLDFSQSHLYLNQVPSASQHLVPALSRLAHEFPDTRPIKPWLVGELGVDSRSARATALDDPSGIVFHDGLWATTVSGSFGTAMSWWWDTYIDRTGARFYDMLGSLAKFVHDVPWDREAFVSARVSATSRGEPLSAEGLSGQMDVLVWVRSRSVQWYHHKDVLVSSAAVSLSGLHSACWQAKILNTRSAQMLRTSRVLSSKGTTRISLPSFTDDIAIHLSAC